MEVRPLFRQPIVSTFLYTLDDARNSDNRGHCRCPSQDGFEPGLRGFVRPGEEVSGERCQVETTLHRQVGDISMELIARFEPSVWSCLRVIHRNDPGRVPARQDRDAILCRDLHPTAANLRAIQPRIGGSEQGELYLASPWDRVPERALRGA